MLCVLAATWASRSAGRQIGGKLIRRLVGVEERHLAYAAASDAASCCCYCSTTEYIVVAAAVATSAVNATSAVTAVTCYCFSINVDGHDSKSPQSRRFLSVAGDCYKEVSND